MDLAVLDIPITKTELHTISTLSPWIASPTKVLGDSVTEKEPLSLRNLVQLLLKSWQFQIWCSMTKAGVRLLKLHLLTIPMSRFVKYRRFIGRELLAAAIKYTYAKLFSPGAYRGIC